jgi:hypothetical protein
MEYIEQKYKMLCMIPSDINEHLPTLYKYSMDCESVIELGVRGCVSSWAFIYGLLKNNKPTKKILLNDIDKCDISELLSHTQNMGVTIDYQWKNDLELDITTNVDMVFIDTWHVYGQLKRELNKFSKITNKYIIMHDTIVDGIYGETLRVGLDANKQSAESGFPIDEITRGLQPAIDEFLENNRDWILIDVYENNNGLSVLKRLQ